jgi:hypothetical protein
MAFPLGGGFRPVPGRSRDWGRCVSVRVLPFDCGGHGADIGREVNMAIQLRRVLMPGAARRAGRRTGDVS